MGSIELDKGNRKTTNTSFLIDIDSYKNKLASKMML